jgi:hypothetical protein
MDNERGRSSIDTAYINRTRSKSQTAITFKAEPSGVGEEPIRNLYIYIRTMGKNECVLCKKRRPYFFLRYFSMSGQTVRVARTRIITIYIL